MRINVEEERNDFKSQIPHMSTNNLISMLAISASQMASAETIIDPEYSKMIYEECDKEICKRLAIKRGENHEG